MAVLWLTSTCYHPVNTRSKRLSIFLFCSSIFLAGRNFFWMMFIRAKQTEILLSKPFSSSTVYTMFSWQTISQEKYGHVYVLFMQILPYLLIPSHYLNSYNSLTALQSTGARSLPTMRSNAVASHFEYNVLTNDKSTSACSL